ncbi:MAG: VCBS repeat-containing protein [Tannerella sp.]|nr:VCBS repeat-containing protein [Tannerella sp.]
MSGISLLRAAPYPLGYVDSSMIRCFTHMGSVTFSPQQKFWQDNQTANALYGFSVPLVGDLNGDGKPEIVALSLNGTSPIGARSPYLFILNGQTGAVLNKFELPAVVEPCRSGYHGSPSQIALVDADKNGFGEIIVCFSSTSASAYRKQIASFEVTGNSFALTQKWKTTDHYGLWWNNGVKQDDPGDYDYDYPIPQIVDINGDGTPELVVYNKVYDATNGHLLAHFDELGAEPGAGSKSAYVGSFSLPDNRDIYYESSIAFPSVYDIDGDGKYDYIAGGKIYYDINLTTGTYKTLNHTEIPDGRTAVADIDGDGEAEIVALTCNVIDRYSSYDFTLRVWKPDFTTNPSAPTGHTVATRTFNTRNNAAQGFSSCLYIGDIDGKVQNGKKLPEISLISGRPFKVSSTYTNLVMDIPVHPNVTDGGIIHNKSFSDADVRGCLVSFTWDNNTGVTAGDRLKVSFMLEHEDRSINTGFSLFDFDNDGTADICYRDEHTLRIISARKSYVTLGESATSVIRMSKECMSFTGFEYPAIADVDADGSADIIVMGRSSGGPDNARGYVLVVEGANRDLAPAPTVWNQFHYHPMKIYENLQTPSPNFHPLDPDYRFYKYETDANPTYFYNSNIMQAVISSSTTAANSKEIIRPIVRTPDAQIIDARIVASGSQGIATFRITNIGDASLPAGTPLKIYWNDVSASSGTIDVTLYPGDTTNVYSYTAQYAGDVGDIIVGDGTLVGGEFQPGSMRECNWADNHAKVAMFLPREDLAVVPRYGTVMIDVLANDILEGSCSDQTLVAADITTPAGAGVLNGDFGVVRIVNNKIMYTASGAASGGVVKFTYKLTCGGVTRETSVYIFILESCTGNFAACANSNYTVCLKKALDNNLIFEWYGEDNATYIGTEFPVINSATDVTFYVKPNFRDVTTGTWASYRTKDFPRGKLTINVTSVSNADTMRWTGAVDRNWLNPDNWVQVEAGKTKAVTWAPTACVDVILGEDCPYYPELEQATECRNIHLENRAMIAGIHHLEYEKVSMDFEPVSREKDGFVMWSAPLKDMYTGDYHFPTASNNPDWGPVYMNFFQSDNPDYPGSVAREKTYTATFGSMGTPLPLGKAFNVHILPDTEGRRFTFPKAFASYTDARSITTTGTLSRVNAGRFITDGVLSSAGLMDLPVRDSAYSLVQVVNPFAAYLKVDEFLTLNSSKIKNTYKIWNGDVNEDFISVLFTGDTMRYAISDAGITTGTEQWIAPFRSFFVEKQQNEVFQTLQIFEQAMVTTAGPAETFVLRSSAEEEGVLRITAKQQSYRNSTILLNEAGAVSLYDPDEDSRKAFLDGVPVLVYTITADNEALAINRSDEFEMPVRLGIRLKNTSQPVTLDFSGVERFGRPVYLTDLESDSKEIDLQRQPSYTFVVRPDANGNGMTELNERFSLRFGAPTGAERIEDDNIRVSAGAGKIYIDFSEGAVSGVTIYDISGVTVYRAEVSGAHLTVPVPSNRMYFVKTHQGNREHPVRKVLVGNN